MERRSESAVKPDMTRPIADKTRAPGFEHCKEAWGLLLALILRQFIRRHKRAPRLDRK